MSTLEELEKKVYSPKNEKAVPPRRNEPRPAVAEREWAKEAKYWQPPREKRKKWIIFIFVFLVVLASGSYWYYGRQAFKKSDVFLSISGSSNVISGEKSRYVVSYKNNSKVRLLNSKLTFKWPDDSEIIGLSEKELGVIVSQKEDTISFDGRLFGPEKEEKEIAVSLVYQPENFNDVFETIETKKIIISSTPIFLNFQMPSRAVSGKEFEFDIEYSNKSDANFSNLEIRLDYPSNFSFISSQPDSFGGSKFVLTKLGSRESNKVKVRGLIQGQEGELFSFVASAGLEKDSKFLVYAQQQTTLQLSSSILWVFQTLEDSRNFIASPGDLIHYKVRYKNTTDIPIINAMITAEFQTNVLDFRALDSPWSVFDSRTNTITWSSASLPELAVLTPFEEGEIQFKIKVKDPPPVKNFQDKNFVIVSVIKITASSVPTSLIGLPLGNEDRLETKVNSKISLNARGYYYDSPLINFGPIPPKVNQKTSYTLVWQIANYSNDLENVKVEAVLPAYVEWLEKTSSSNENITYDPASGKVTWLIDKLSAGLGIISPARQIAFQIAIVPSSPQIDQILEILSESQLSAQDSFTSQTLQVSDQNINTTLPDDPKVDYLKGKVVQ